MKNNEKKEYEQKVKNWSKKHIEIEINNLNNQQNTDRLLRFFGVIATAGFESFILSKAQLLLESVNWGQSKIEDIISFASMFGVLAVPIIAYITLLGSTSANSKEYESKIDVLYNYLDADESNEKDKNDDESKKLK